MQMQAQSAAAGAQPVFYQQFRPTPSFPLQQQPPAQPIHPHHHPQQQPQPQQPHHYQHYPHHHHHHHHPDQPQDVSKNAVNPSMIQSQQLPDANTNPSVSSGYYPETPPPHMNPDQLQTAVSSPTCIGTGGNVGASMSSAMVLSQSDPVVKKKRGRPRKYATDSNGTASPLTAVSATGGEKGRRGSSKKAQLCIPGVFLLTEHAATGSRTGGVSISLAGQDGRVVGGRVAQFLVAATPCQCWHIGWSGHL